MTLQCISSGHFVHAFNRFRFFLIQKRFYKLSVKIHAKKNLDRKNLLIENI